MNTLTYCILEVHQLVHEHFGGEPTLSPGVVYQKQSGNFMEGIPTQAIPQGQDHRRVLLGMALTRLASIHENPLRRSTQSLRPFVSRSQRIPGPAATHI